MPRMESVLNPAVTKRQLNINLLSMAAESMSSMPPGPENGRSETQDRQEKSKWYFLFMACFPTVCYEERLVNPKQRGKGKGGLRILGYLRSTVQLFSHYPPLQETTGIVAEMRSREAEHLAKDCIAYQQQS